MQSVGLVRKKTCYEVWRPYVKKSRTLIVIKEIIRQTEKGVLVSLERPDVTTWLPVRHVSFVTREYMPPGLRLAKIPQWLYDRAVA